MNMKQTRTEIHQPKSGNRSNQSYSVSNFFKVLDWVVFALQVSLIVLYNKNCEIISIVVHRLGYTRWNIEIRMRIKSILTLNSIIVYGMRM
jgi:hypothetical protein